MFINIYHKPNTGWVLRDSEFEELIWSSLNTYYKGPPPVPNIILSIVNVYKKRGLPVLPNLKIWYDETDAETGLYWLETSYHFFNIHYPELQFKNYYKCLKNFLEKKKWIGVKKRWKNNEFK